MSVYLNLFVRKNDEVVRLTDYSRNTVLYRAFENIVPYEDVTIVTEEMLDRVWENLDKELYEVKRAIKLSKEKMNVLKANARTDEDWEWITTISNTIDEFKNEKKNIKYFSNVVEFLKTIVDDMKYREGRNYLYAGIEVDIGTLEDAVREGY
jgi:ribosome-binding ATPase YchF (GTP1/OBG family)